MRRQNLLLKTEVGNKKMNENIQHLAADLIYFVKWSSMHKAGIPQLVLIPQRSSYGIMRQSGYPILGPETAKPSLSVCSKCLWRKSDFHGSHVSVLSQNPGCEVPRSLWQLLVALRHCPQALLRIWEIIGTHLATGPLGEVWLPSRWLWEKWVLPVWICPTDALSHLGVSVPREMCFAP